MRTGKFPLQNSAVLTAGTWQLVDKLLPADNYTKLLIHGNSNTIADSSISNKTITNTSVTLDAAIFQFPSTSMKFNGTSAYLTVADNADWNFSTGDFTVEGWIRFSSYSPGTSYILWSHGNVAVTDYSVIGFRDSKFYFRVVSGSSDLINDKTVDAVFSLNTWYHVAFVRKSNTMYYFLNGILAGYVLCNITYPDFTGLGYIGTGNYSQDDFINGWLQDFRISKGIARYTESFDPFTKLLIHSNGSDASTSFVDSVAGKTITASGDAQIVNVAGSGLFNGSSDYLTIPDVADWDMGSGDFTIDCWIRLTAFASRQWILGPSPSSWGLSIDSATSIRMWYADGGSAYFTFTVSSMSANTWYHVAIVRSGNNLMCFLNGVKQGANQDATGINFDRSELVMIGAYYPVIPEGFLNGWLDELRISKGIARWTVGFTPQTTAYSSDSYTKLLLHCDGRTGLTTFIDDSGKTITTHGAAQITLAQYKVTGNKFNQAVFFDGAGDYLTLADSDDWSFGAGDFTIDFWVKFNLIDNSVYVFCEQYQDGNNYWTTYISNKKLSLNFVTGGVGKGQYEMTSAWAPSVNTWYHVAFERNGTSALIFINGVSQVLTEIVAFGANDVQNVTGVLSIGSRTSSAYWLDGWLDELRISKGIARWVGNFSPESAEYTGTVFGCPPRELLVGHEAMTSNSLSGIDMYTKLLIHADGSNGSTAFNDAATGKAITANGNALISTVQKKFGTGSVLLDGTGDYLTLADSPDWCFGDQDFTIDFWVRFNDLTGNQGLIAQYVDANNNWNVYKDTNNRLSMNFYVGGVAKAEYYTTGVQNFLTNTWYHLAFQRLGATGQIFVDGVSKAVTVTTAFSSNNVGDLASVLNVGYYGISSTYLNGWIDEIRISKGIARWTANFITPTTNYGINGDTDVQYKVLCRLVNGSVSPSGYYIRPNNDSSSNYGYQHLDGISTTVSALRGIAYDSLLLSWNATNSGKVTLSSSNLYAKSGNTRSGLVQSVESVDGTLVPVILFHGVCWNNSVDPITSLNVYSNVTGGIGNASQIELYARRATL